MKQNLLKTLFMCLFTLAGTAAIAKTCKIGRLWYELSEETQTATVTFDNEGNPYNGNVNIPEKVEADGVVYDVTAIGNGAFMACCDLGSVTIPNSITRIGNSAFAYCDLGSVIIPNSVTHIGKEAFQNCTNLSSATIGDGVTFIDSNAFDNCSSLSSITLPINLTYIGPYAFWNCTSLTSMVIPDNVKSYGQAVLGNCSSLTSITFGSSIIQISPSDFTGCSSLEKIVVASDNPYYDSREDCNAVINTFTNVLVFGCKGTHIPNSVTCIGEYAFYDCSGLTEVVIPDSVTVVSGGAFHWCPSLVSVTSLSPTPPTAYSYTFDESTYQMATLYVPKGSKALYEQVEGWEEFLNIQELSQSDIKNIKAANADGIYYDFQGYRLAAPKRGLNIINGKKVVVK